MFIVSHFHQLFNPETCPSYMVLSRGLCEIFGL